MMPLIFVFFLLFSTQTNAQPVQPAVVDDFSLLDHQGNFHQLSYYSDKKAVVLISAGNGCPILRQGLARIQELKKEFEPRGVEFFFLNANPQDTHEDILKEAAEYGIDMPILEDPAGTVAGALNIKRTAEAVVIDPSSWQIVYQGAIDDRLDYEGKRAEAEHHYLKDALTQLLSGQKVLTVQTEVKGCLISVPKPGTLTYTKDIAPVLAKKCVQCHSAGGIAPWSMDNYEKVKGWAAMIREVVRTKRMPPWDADPRYGRFKDDVSLSAEETARIVHWVEQGAKRGRGADPLQKKDAGPKEWEMGKPGMIFSLKEKQVIPADGLDVFAVVEADRTVEEDLWVRAMEIRPGNAKLVHHCNIVIKNEQSGTVFKDEQFPGANMETGEVIAGYSPGIREITLPDDTGIFIPRGSKVVFRIHYVTTGKPEEDLTRVAFYLHREKPRYVLSTATIVNRDIHIPPGEKNYKLSAAYTFAEDVTLTGLQPHMHYRGKSMRFTAYYPDGREEVLLSTPRYRFNWQRIYSLREPKKIPAGTKIVLDGVYDNSRQNLRNPDPGQAVVYGPGSGAEMFTGVLFYVEGR